MIDMEDVEVLDVQPEGVEEVESPVEKEALSKGWKPQDQFEGNKDEWRSASQFLEHGQILDQLHQLKRNNKKLTDTLEKVVASTDKIQEESYERAKKQLQKELSDAIDIGDKNRAAHIMQQSVELETTKPAVSTTTFSAEVNSEVARFTADNPWFNNMSSPETVAMTTYAKMVNQQLSNQGLDQVVAIKETERLVKAQFPTQFKGDTKTSMEKTIKVAPVASQGTPPIKKDKIPAEALSDDHQKIIKQLKQTLGSRFNLDKYIENMKLAEGA